MKIYQFLETVGGKQTGAKIRALFLASSRLQFFKRTGTHVTVSQIKCDKSLFFMPPNKIWGIIISDRPSVRPSVCPCVRSIVRPFENIFLFIKVCHLNFTFIWGHLSRTVTQFLFYFSNSKV